MGIIREGVMCCQPLQVTLGRWIRRKGKSKGKELKERDGEEKGRERKWRGRCNVLPTGKERER